MLHNKLAPKFMRLKEHTLIFSQFLWVRHQGMPPLGSSCSRSPISCKKSGWSLQIHEISLGEGKSAFKLPHMVFVRLHFLTILASPIGLPHIAADFPPAKQYTVSKGEHSRRKFAAFLSPNLRRTWHYFFCILFVRSY